MKQKLLALFLVLVLTVSAFAGCGNDKNGKESKGSSREPGQESGQETKETTTEIRIGSLKGPTSMGLVSLMDQSAKGAAKGNYDFTMVTAADELLGKVVSGELDVAMIPANVASVLYQKMKDKGGISVININTLGVLYVVSSDDSIQSIGDLKGRTVYLTGKGQTPDYALQYLMKENGLADGDVVLEYKSEAAEVAAVLAEKEGAVGLLPQPFVTSALSQNEALKMVLDLTAEWDKVQGEGGSSLVTGVTVIRNEFLNQNTAAVKTFLEEYRASVQFTNENTEEAARLITAQGIVAKEPIAQKAIPYCNITYIDGEDMKTALGGYLQVLFGQNPQSIGGGLPAEDFYWLGN